MSWTKSSGSGDGVGIFRPSTVVGGLFWGEAPQPATSLRVTPWRSVVVPRGAARAGELAEAGFATAPDSPWRVLTACAGAPSCGRTTTATRDLAREAAPFVDPTGPALHVTGCDRACGHPARDHVTVLDPTSAADVLAAQGCTPERDS